MGQKGFSWENMELTRNQSFPCLEAFSWLFQLWGSPCAKRKNWMTWTKDSEQKYKWLSILCHLTDENSNGNDPDCPPLGHICIIVHLWHKQLQFDKGKIGHSVACLSSVSRWTGTHHNGACNCWSHKARYWANAIGQPENCAFDWHTNENPAI